MSERIRELYEAIQNDPGDAVAVQGLVDEFTTQQDWPGLLDLYLFLADQADEAAKKASWRHAAADVAETRLNDPIRAIELYNSSLDDDPDGVLTALAEMRRLFRAIEDWENYVEVAQNEVELTDDTEAAALILLEMGDVFENSVGDVDNALECYRVAIEYDNRCVQALWAARRLYRAQHDWQTVCDLLQTELEVCQKTEAQIDILRELAALYSRELDNQNQAENCYRRLLELQPDDQAALKFLGSNDAELKANQESDTIQVAATDFERETMVGTPSILADENIEPAIEYSAPVELIERDTELHEPIESPEEGESEHTDDKMASAESIEPIGLSGEHDGESPDAIGEPDADGADGQFESHSNGDESIDSAAVDASLAAENDDARADAISSEDTAPKSSTDDGIVEDEPAEPQPDETERLEMFLELEALAGQAEGDERIARLMHALEYADGDSAGQYYAEVVASRPADIEIYWRVGRTLRVNSSQAQAIAAQLEDLAANQPDCATVLQAHRLVFGAAHLEEARTVDFKLRDLAKKSGDARVVDWQIQRLLEGEKWRNAQQMITERLGGDPSDARLGALREMARLTEARLGRADKAADFWRQVFQSDKTDEDARRALLTAYEQNGKWKEYVDVLSLEVDSIPVDETSERLAGLKKLVTVMSQHLRQDAKVIGLYAQILEIDPQDQEAQDALCEKYEKMRKWPDLVELLRTRADALEGTDRLDMLMRIGRVYLEKMRNQMEAIAAFEDVLVEDPESADALQALNELYEKRRDWDNLIATRVRLAEGLEPDEALTSLKDLANYAAKKIRRPNITQQLWEQILQTEPGDLDARRALVSIYEQTKDWDSLASTLHELIGLVESDEERASLNLKLGSVFQDRLNDNEQAAVAWRGVLEADPTNRRAKDSYKKSLIQLQAWDELSSFFIGQGNGAELVRILEGQVGVQTDEDSKIALLFRATDLYIDELEQSDKAVRALERILQIDGANQRAAKTLEPIYREKKDFRKLSSTLQVLLTHETDPDERIRLMTQAAELAETNLRNPVAAFDQLQRVVHEAPNNRAAREAFLRLGSTLDQWGTVHDVLVDALHRLDDEDDRIQVQLTLGRILDEEMNAQDDALNQYQSVLDSDSSNMEALTAVESLFGRSGRWYDLLGILEQKNILLDDEEEQLTVMRQQARIHDEQLGDAMAAIDSYRAILSLRNTDSDALNALQRLLSTTEQYEDLRDILDLQLELALESDEQDGVIRHRLDLADVLLSHLDAVHDGIDQLRLVIEDEPQHPHARRVLESHLDRAEGRQAAAQILEPLFIDEENWPSTVRVLSIRLDDADDDESRSTLLRQIGQLCLERTHDQAGAFDAFSRLYEAEPTDDETLNTLCELAESGDRWSDVARLVEMNLGELEDEDRIITLLKRLAGIYEHRMDSLGMAVDAYRRALTIMPSDVQSMNELARLFSTGQQWTELLEIYQQKLQFCDEAEESLTIQFKIAELFEDLLSDAQGAITVYSGILEADETNSRALTALARLYGNEEMFAELAETYERQFACADDAEMTAIQLKLAEVRELRLGEGEQALDIYRSVIIDEPDNVDAKRALERLLLDPDLKGQAAACLAPIYEQGNQWQDLAGTYEIRQELADDDAHRIETFA